MPFVHVWGLLLLTVTVTCSYGPDKTGSHVPNCCWVPVFMKASYPQDARVRWEALLSPPAGIRSSVLGIYVHCTAQCVCFSFILYSSTVMKCDPLGQLLGPRTLTGPVAKSWIYPFFKKSQLRNTHAKLLVWTQFRITLWGVPFYLLKTAYTHPVATR